MKTMGVVPLLEKHCGTTPFSKAEADSQLKL